MPVGEELLGMGGVWVHPVRLLSALVVVSALGLLVRAWLGKRVSPWMWISVPIAAYAAGIVARLLGHAETVEALVQADADQATAMAMSAVSISVIAEFLAANLLLRMLCVGALIALVASFLVKPENSDDPDPKNPALALRLIALAQLALAAAMPWRSRLLEGFYELHIAFAQSAPDLLVANVTAAHEHIQGANGLFVVALVGLLVAVGSLYLAGIKAGQSKGALVAPVLLTVAVAATAYGDADVHRFNLDTSVAGAEARREATQKAEAEAMKDPEFIKKKKELDRILGRLPKADAGPPSSGVRFPDVGVSTEALKARKAVGESPVFKALSAATKEQPAETKAALSDAGVKASPQEVSP